MSVVISHHVQYLMLLHLDAASGYSSFLLSLFGYAYLHTNLQTTELAGMVACDTTMLMQLSLRTSCRPLLRRSTRARQHNVRISGPEWAR